MLFPFHDQGNVNVITVDWEKGAAGPSYPQSVANTELVGRQTGLLLIDMLGLGLRPSDIHIVGFSLGAHIAACASHLIQSRLLVKIGRITGKLNHMQKRGPEVQIKKRNKNKNDAYL